MDKNFRRIYHDSETGEKLVELTFRGGVVASTVDQDIANYPILNERYRDSFEVLEIDVGAYSQDFELTNEYKVDLDTKKLLFSYPDSNEPEVEQPYQPPISAEIAQLKERLQMQDATMEELMFIIIPELNGGGI